MSIEFFSSQALRDVGSPQVLAQLYVGPMTPVATFHISQVGRPALPGRSLLFPAAGMHSRSQLLSIDGRNSVVADR
ncbi:hypothetical protein GHK80_10680 [Sinorhizobium medicae]|nr:hypothetical protein [Sinorhizobium medicae]MQX76664.1 hypothetical protein [Sinorhizobium medicae]